METKLVRERIGEVSLDFFLSPEFIPRIKPKNMADCVSFLNAQGMLRSVMDRISKTAEHAIYGKKPVGMDYSTGCFIGSREIELFVYMKERELTKAEFVFMHQAPIPQETLEAVVDSGVKTVHLREPLGFGVDFWVDDCYGRVSEVRVIPDGRVMEQMHGRAGVLRRDPVEAIKHLSDKDFYAAITNPELMHVLKSTTKLDEKFSEAKTYSEMIAKLASPPVGEGADSLPDDKDKDSRDKGETEEHGPNEIMSSGI